MADGVGAHIDGEGQVRDKFGNPIIGARRGTGFVPFSDGDGDGIGLTFAAQRARDPVFATGNPDGALAAIVQRVPTWAWLALGALVVFK